MQARLHSTTYNILSPLIDFKQAFFVFLLLTESEEDIFEELLHGKLDFNIDPWPNISESAKERVKKMLVRDPQSV